jgi:recombination protein RecA
MARIRRNRRNEVDEVEVDEFKTTMAGLRKRFGEASFHAAARGRQPDRISTNSFMLDFALLGGIPHNRMSMIVGEKHAGKSMLGDMCIAGAQRQYPDQVPIKLDIEDTHEAVWSSKLGVDQERLHVFHSETGESAVDAADALVRTKEVSIVVIDSIAALTPMREIETSAEEDAVIAMQSRLVGSMIRKVNAGLIAERNRGHYVTVLFINQFRMKIGVSWGDPRSVPGGKALEFATSVQLIIKNKEKMGKDEHDVEAVEENEHAFDIKKNKLNNGPRTGEFRICRISDPETGLTEGMVNDAETMLTYAKRFGAYTGAGSAWTLDFWDEEHKFRGIKEAITRLYEEPALKWKLRNFLICEQAQHLGMPTEFYERFYPE